MLIQSVDEIPMVTVPKEPLRRLFATYSNPLHRGGNFFA